MFLFLVILLMMSSVHSYLVFNKTTVQCAGTNQQAIPGGNRCYPQDPNCHRVIINNFISLDESASLIAVADRGIDAVTNSETFATFQAQGPTIVDINSGFVRGPKAVRPLNMYDGFDSSNLFTEAEIKLYNDTLRSVRSIIEIEFDAKGVYFTGPTFITKIIGGDSDSLTDSVTHDEYWHPHVDKRNTAHYDYSGLVYLSSGGGVDFTGGEFHFLTGLNQDKSVITGVNVVEAGQLVMFTSGDENPHRFTRVTSGTRYVLAFWFTCDERADFGSFLDGSAVEHYKGSRKAEAAAVAGEEQYENGCGEITDLCMKDEECVEILNNSDFENCMKIEICAGVVDCMTKQRKREREL